MAPRHKWVATASFAESGSGRLVILQRPVGTWLPRSSHGIKNEHQPGLEESRTAPVDFYPVPPSSSDMFSFAPSDSPAGDASLGASSSILAPESFLRSNVEPAAASAVRTEPRYCGLPITPDIFPPKNEPEWGPSTWIPAPSQGPAAFMLNMDMVQAKAEALEQQARRDIEDTQQLADRHSKEMLETRSFRVTQACEHCRYRKAKVSRLAFTFFRRRKQVN